jgi:cytochrome c-type biogenesis protein CcmH/NrfG
MMTICKPCVYRALLVLAMIVCLYAVYQLGQGETPHARKTREEAESNRQPETSEMDTTAQK